MKPSCRMRASACVRCRRQGSRVMWCGCPGTSQPGETQGPLTPGKDHRRSTGRRCGPWCALTKTAPSPPHHPTRRSPGVKRGANSAPKSGTTWCCPVWFPALSRPRSGSSRSTTNPGLATDLPWAPWEVKVLYQDRRPMEQIPLAAKPMVGVPIAGSSGQKRAAIGCQNRPCRRVRSRASRPPPCRCAPPDFGTGIQNVPLGT